MQPFHEESLAGYGYSTYNNWAAKVPSPSLAKSFAWGLNTPLMHNQSRYIRRINAVFCTFYLYFSSVYNRAHTLVLRIRIRRRIFNRW
jgi:hypothetical protein